MANETELLEPVEDEAPSLRDTLTDAVEEHAPELAAPETPVSAEPKPAVDPTKPPVQAPAPEGKVAPEKPAQPGAPEQLKPPSQWKPHVREQWNKLPREVQEEVLRREGDSMRLIGSVGPKIRLADGVMQELTPYAETLQTNGVAPQQFLGDVFSTIHTLARGAPQDKAEVVANIIQSYGVDLRTLDALLTNRMRTPPEIAHARQMAARAQSVLYEQQQGISQHQNQQINVEAEKFVAAFGADPKHEFLDDVRDLMADLIESGRATDLEDAYASAVWANPDTRKILLQREAQARVQGKTQRAQAARRASSSVSGSPTSGAVAQAPAGGSLRESIEAAFDEHTSL
jgi:hypothetical protein